MIEKIKMKILPSLTVAFRIYLVQDVTIMELLLCDRAKGCEYTVGCKDYNEEDKSFHVMRREQGRFVYVESRQAKKCFLIT